MNEGWVTISRDPFAREELQRQSVQFTSFFTTIASSSHSGKGCFWCGGWRRGGDNERTLNRYLWRYRVLSDGGSERPVHGMFCSVECMRSYHS